MAAREFEPSWLAKRFAALAATTERLPRRYAAAITLVILATLGLIDEATGPEINLILFYLLASCFACWCLGARAGFATGAVTVAIATALNGLHLGFPLPRQAFSTGAIVWNVLSRLTATCVVVILTSGLRGALDLERHRAETDMLTGALNKSAFVARMTAAIARARSRDRALVLGYLDLDGFKQVNDRHGHAAGDGVLCAFAEAGAQSIRRSDLFARFGGDEFVVLLTVPSCGMGDGAAEVLHARLSTILRGTGYPVTCSMGALIIDAAAVTDRAELINAADRLMYEVKRSGKDAIRIARADLNEASVLRTVSGPARNAA